jgi:uncharacterized protein YkwD
MRLLRLVFILAVLLGLAACKSGGTILPPGGGGDGDHATQISAMLARHNSTRSGLGLGALSQNALLNQIAQTHAEYMASTGNFSHLDGAGHNVDWRATAIGYNWVQIGENIGYDTSPADLYTAWLGSPGHYANIVDSGFQEIGIGVADAGIYEYWCIDFGGR